MSFMVSLLSSYSSMFLLGPLLNGLTSILFEGLPMYPPDRVWQIVQDHNVCLIQLLSYLLE